MNTENEIYCEIEYSCDDTSGLLNHAFGICEVRKRLKKKHGPIDSANRMCLKLFLYGLVIFIIAAVCCFIQPTRAISPHVAILGAIYVLLALSGLFRYFKIKKSVKTLSGRITVGPDGICDRDSAGFEYNFPIDDLDCVVISQKVTAIFFKSVSVFFFFPTTPESDTDLCGALYKCGKSDLIYRRRVR